MRMREGSFSLCALGAVVATLLSVAAGCGHRSAAMPPSAQSQAITAGDSPPAVSPASPKASADSRAPEASSAAEAPAAAAPDLRPLADRGPSRPGEAEKITFDDLNIGMQADMVFRPFLLIDHDRVKELDGKRVTIRGYIHPGATGKGIKEFVLLRNLQCKFGAGGQADHLAQVFMKKGSSVDYRLGDVKIEGTLKVQPFEGPDGNTWSIYRLEDAVAK